MDRDALAEVGAITSSSSSSSRVHVPARSQELDRHVSWLQEACRISGARFDSLSRSTRYPAKDFQADLKACFGVDVSDDVDVVHPPSLCRVCRLVVGRYRDAVANKRDYAHEGRGYGPVHEWQLHSDDCACCPHVQRSAGRRPKK